MTVRLPPLQSNLSSISSSKVMTIDFREVAPAASREKMYVGQSDKARWGGLAVGVPGELRGLKKAHELWGKLKWSDLVRPNAELAKGWKVSKELERRIEVSSHTGFWIVCSLSFDTRCSQPLCIICRSGKPFSLLTVVYFVKVTL